MIEDLKPVGLENAKSADAFLTDRGKASADNPFIFGPTVTGEAFKGKQDILDKLVTNASDKGSAVFIAGPRSGRTSTLHTAAERIVKEKGASGYDRIDLDDANFTSGKKDIQALLKRISTQFDGSSAGKNPVYIFEGLEGMVGSYSEEEIMQVVQLADKLKSEGSTLLWCITGDPKMEGKGELPLAVKQKIIGLSGDAQSVVNRPLNTAELRDLVSGGKPPVFTEAVVNMLVAQSGGHPEAAAGLAYKMRALVTRAQRIGNFDEVMADFQDAAPDVFANLNLVIQGLVDKGFDPENAMAWTGGEPKPDVKYYSHMVPGFSSTLFREHVKDRKVKTIARREANDHIVASLKDNLMSPVHLCSAIALGKIGVMEVDAIRQAQQVFQEKGFNSPRLINMKSLQAGNADQIQMVREITSAGGKDFFIIDLVDMDPGMKVTDECENLLQQLWTRSDDHPRVVVIGAGKDTMQKQFNRALPHLDSGQLFKKSQSTNLEEFEGPYIDKYTIPCGGKALQIVDGKVDLTAVKPKDSKLDFFRGEYRYTAYKQKGGLFTKKESVEAQKEAAKQAEVADYLAKSADAIQEAVDAGAVFDLVNKLPNTDIPTEFTAGKVRDALTTLRKRFDSMSYKANTGGHFREKDLLAITYLRELVTSKLSRNQAIKPDRRQDVGQLNFGEITIDLQTFDLAGSRQRYDAALRVIDGLMDGSIGITVEDLVKPPEI